MRTSNQGLESKKEEQAIRGRQGAEGQRRMPGGSRCRGARRRRHHSRGLPFKSRHRPRPAAAAGTSPLTAAAQRSAAPRGGCCCCGCCCYCGSCCRRRRRPTSGTCILGPGGFPRPSPRPAPPWCPGSSPAWWCECGGGGVRPAGRGRGNRVGG